MKPKLRIVFYGTPEFAVPSLEILIRHKKELVAVVTAPDKPSGRGLSISQSPVKRCAEEHGISVLQPNNLKDVLFLEELKSFKPDLQIVVAFRMLPEQVWRLPSKGTFNLHASLLPQYRGAAPINWAIINGEKETGLSTFFLQHMIDTGDIIFQKKLNISQEENAGELHDRMKSDGAELVLHTVNAIEEGTLQVRSQEISGEDKILRTAPKLTKENTRLDSKKTYIEAYNFIRGLSPYPAAYTELFNEESGLSLTLKIFKSDATEFAHSHPPGYIETDQKNFLRVYFLNGYLSILELQVAGRNKVKIKDFLNGFKLEGVWKIR